MKKPSKHWEDNLGNRLQNLQADTSIRSWERLEAALEDKPKKRPWLLIAAAIALLMAPAGFWLWRSGNPTDVGGSTLATHQPSQAPPIQQAGEPAEGQTSVDQPNAAALAEGNTTTAPSPAQGHAQLPEGMAAENSKPLPTKQEQPALASEQGFVQQRKGPRQGANPVKMDNSVTPEANRSLPHTTNALAQQPRLGDARTNESEASRIFTAPEASYDSQNVQATTTPAIPSALQAAAPQASVDVPKADLLAASTVVPEPFAAPVSTIEVPEVSIQRPLGLVLREAALAKAEESPKKKKGASLWVEALPTLSYYMIEPSKNDRVMVTSVASEPALSGSRLGGQLAAGITLPVLKKLSWKSGGYYWYQQQHLSYTYQNARPDAYALTADANGISRLETVHNQQSNTIDMPLHNLGVSTGLSYKVSGKGLQSFLETEVMAHYNVHQKISSFVSLGYAIKTKFISKTSLKVGPAVQYQLNSNEALTPHFKDKPISFGIQLGVGFKE